MKKRKHTVKDRDFTYWIWEAPELEKELPELFSIAGEVTIAEGCNNWSSEVVFDIELHKPLVLGPPGELVINGTTGAFITGPAPSVSARIKPLPKNGDTKVHIFLELRLDTFDKDEEITLDDFRRLIREFVLKMTKTWAII